MQMQNRNSLILGTVVVFNTLQNTFMLKGQKQEVVCHIEKENAEHMGDECYCATVPPPGFVVDAVTTQLTLQDFGCIGESLRFSSLVVHTKRLSAYLRVSISRRFSYDLRQA